jgi:predicted DNA-binding transcriptional regulator YafY
MANSKHAHFRYNILDNCFRRYQNPLTIDELKAEINENLAEVFPGEAINDRTLRKDIQIFRNPIKGFGAPLETVKSGGKNVYRYNNKNFSIAEKGLLPQENELITAATQLLERFENHPKYERLSEALIKFQDQEENDSGKHLLHYDHNEEYTGFKFLKPLYFAIQKEHVLKVNFKGFKSDEVQNFEFHPHILKQYNRRWFVFGYNKTKKIERWSIPLDDRLIDFEEMQNRNYVQSKTDWNSFFREMVGVIRPVEAKSERVVLKFYNGRENYFKSKPFQPDFEEFFEGDKQDQVWIDTIINPELVQQILSYGKDVEVLEPESLREILKNQADMMKGHYGK